jgi:hypothetical protein
MIDVNQAVRLLATTQTSPNSGEFLLPPPLADQAVFEALGVGYVPRVEAEDMDVPAGALGLIAVDRRTLAYNREVKGSFFAYLEPTKAGLLIKSGSTFVQREKDAYTADKFINDDINPGNGKDHNVTRLLRLLSLLSGEKVKGDPKVSKIDGDKLFPMRLPMSKCITPAFELFFTSQTFIPCDLSELDHPVPAPEDMSIRPREQRLSILKNELEARTNGQEEAYPMSRLIDTKEISITRHERIVRGAIGKFYEKDTVPVSVLEVGDSLYIDQLGVAEKLLILSRTTPENNKLLSAILPKIVETVEAGGRITSGRKLRLRSPFPYAIAISGSVSANVLYEPSKIANKPLFIPSTALPIAELKKLFAQLDMEYRIGSESEPIKSKIK